MSKEEKKQEAPQQADSVDEAVLRQVVTMKSTMTRAAVTQIPKVIQRVYREATGGDVDSVDKSIEAGCNRALESGQKMADHVVNGYKWLKGKK